jgi:hypothetical protein
MAFGHRGSPGQLVLSCQDHRRASTSPLLVGGGVRQVLDDVYVFDYMEVESFQQESTGVFCFYT